MTATFASVDRGAFVINFRDGMSRVARLAVAGCRSDQSAAESVSESARAGAAADRRSGWRRLRVAVAVAVLFGRAARDGGVLAFGLALEVTSMAAVSLVWRSNGALVATPGTGGLGGSFERYNPGASQVGVLTGHFVALEPTDLPGRVTLRRALVGECQA